MQRDLGVGCFKCADCGDEGMLEKAGFGLGHARNGSAEHHLDGRLGLESIFDAVDLEDIGLIGAHPAADAGVEFVEVFDDEGSATVFSVGANEIEGDDEGITELSEMIAEPMSSGERHVGSVKESGANGANDGAVGADDRAGWIQVQIAQNAHGVAMATAGGDDDFNAGAFGEAESSKVAGADAAVAIEESSVHVDSDDARRHSFKSRRYPAISGCDLCGGRHPVWADHRFHEIFYAG